MAPSPPLPDRSVSRPTRARFHATSRTDPFLLLVAEHDLLRRGLRRVRVVAELGDDPDLPNALQPLFASLRRHQEREDRALYPLCERMFGGEDGATAVLRGEHEAIREAIEALMRKGPGHPAQVPSWIDAFRSELEGHFAKEERILFPLVAALLSRTEMQALARRLRAPRPAVGEG